MDEALLEAVARRAAGPGGGPPAAVVPLRDGTAAERFLCAFPRSGADPGWLLLDVEGEPVREVWAVRDAAEVVAMCETAEEAAAALVADEALPLLERAAALADEAGSPAAALAARATIEALEAMVEVLPGLRVAEAAYLDRIAHGAALVGDRFDLLKEAAGDVSAGLDGTPGEPLEALAQALWDGVRLLARDGAPDHFRQAMEAAMGVAAAFAEDVERNYLVELIDDDAGGERT